MKIKCGLFTNIQLAGTETEGDELLSPLLLQHFEHQDSMIAILFIWLFKRLDENVCQTFTSSQMQTDLM